MRQWLRGLSVRRLGVRGLRAAARDGRDVAGAVEGEGEAKVVPAVGDGGEGQAGARGVLEVGAGVRDGNEAHFGGWGPVLGAVLGGDAV